MTAFLIGAIVCLILDLLLLYRVFRGPTAADRICAMDALDLVTALALALYSLHTGRTIYLDIALVVAAFASRFLIHSSPFYLYNPVRIVLLLFYCLIIFFWSSASAVTVRQSEMQAAISACMSRMGGALASSARVATAALPILSTSMMYGTIFDCVA